MKIPTIKKFFNKPETPAKKGVVTVAKVADIKKMTAPKKPVPKKSVAKKASVKKVAKAAPRTTVITPKKPSAKKAVALKPVVKKAVAPKKSSVKLVVASDSESFWIQDGQILNSLIALELALKTMPMAIYEYHASNDGNHFADWVEIILADSTCATLLRKAKTPKTAHAAIKKHLSNLS